MPAEFPKITLITPVFNQEVYLEETILSVLNQGYPNLEYIIVDGASTDRTVSIIEKYSANLSSWVSEKDNGLYDALQKGFQRSTGEIMGWLNADDILHRKSLFTVADIFENNRELNWLQGYPTVIDATGRIVDHRKQRSSKYSFYLKSYRDGVFIQQESTFWRRNLWEKAGAEISRKYKYAGDFELWMRFFRYADLVETDALIGAFRMRNSGQLSVVHYDEYLSECDRIIDAEIATLPSADKETLRKLERNRDKRLKYSWLPGSIQDKLFGPNICPSPVKLKFNRKRNSFTPTGV